MWKNPFANATFGDHVVHEVPGTGGRVIHKREVIRQVSPQRSRSVPRSRSAHTPRRHIQHQHHHHTSHVTRPSRQLYDAGSSKYSDNVVITTPTQAQNGGDYGRTATIQNSPIKGNIYLPQVIRDDIDGDASTMSLSSLRDAEDDAGGWDIQYLDDSLDSPGPSSPRYARDHGYPSPRGHHYHQAYQEHQGYHGDEGMYGHEDYHDFQGVEQTRSLPRYHSRGGRREKVVHRPVHSATTSRKVSRARRQEGGKFLQDVQYELEDRRNEWKDEVDRLSDSFIRQLRTGEGEEKKVRTSYVDTSSGTPVFKAHFDMDQFHPSEVSVEIDLGRICVEAKKAGGTNKNVTKSFRQRVRLPHFSDERRARYYYQPGGILTVEVPLIYYFPPKTRKERARHMGTSPSSKFVQSARRSDGRKVIKMSQDLDPMINPDTIQVNILDERRIQIYAEGHKEPGRSGRVLQFSKEMKLPRNADLDGIQSVMDDQGKLWIEVPLLEKHVTYGSQSRGPKVTPSGSTVVDI